MPTLRLRQLQTQLLACAFALLLCLTGTDCQIETEAIVLSVPYEHA
ncbi:MAG: hypothetical protein ABI988_00825 [Nitrospirota bacterium]